MTTVAYLANQFPSPTEPYVGTEIQELRLRGVKVIAGSVRSPDVESMRDNSCSKDEILSLQPIRLVIAFKALCLTFMRWGRVSRFLRRALLQGNEPPKQRLGSVLHTWLGAYYAVLLRHREVNHIHVHHGYFGSWIAMVAASLLEVDFSLTLHGSDLLVHAAYLDIKLNNCKFCITISEYNRRYILNRFPALDSGKVIVSRLGVEAVRDPAFSGLIHRRTKNRFFLLGTGRLHAVKNHAFLVQACAHLRSQGLDLKCAIAGAGPERERLQTLIEQNQLTDCVRLLGHVSHSDMDLLYRSADLFVLTSISEGIPLVLMEAMARGTLVLAPAITGIPELVIPGITGFLYTPGDFADFARRILILQELLRPKKRSPASRLAWIRHAARVQVRRNFNRGENLARFGSIFLELVAPRKRSCLDENSLLQQI
jgi:colanic acid/amylovoran biosynthesis glycosyltransferase